MLVQLSDTLPCETMKGPVSACNQPARVGILRVVESFGFAGYVMEPICSHCIAALGVLAGQVTPASETIATTTIKEVLARRLGIEGSEEVLAALRAAGQGDDDDGTD